jgi:surface antigen/LysM repeat protein
MVFVAYAVVLPQQFSFDYTTRGSDVVLATYEDILHQAQQQDGAISFEKLLVGGDEQTQISYIVQPGDNLSEIAKSFGTTVAAIMQINKISNAHTVRPGQRLTIAYEENVLYEVKEPSTLSEFAQKYNLSVDDLLTLNYLDNPDEQIEPGQQLFLAMSRRDAEKEGLIEKEKFEMLDLPEEEIVPEEEIPLEEIVEVPQQEQPAEEQPAEPSEVQQIVITAEQTQQHLEDIKQGKKVEAPANEQPKPEAAKKQDTPKTAPEATKPAAPEAKSLDQFKQDTTTCGANQCAFDNKCYSKPAHAVCANDNKQAWTCEKGYTDTGKACVANEEKPQKKATAKKADDGILNQWYFNPRKAGFPGFGWGAGHCTEYAAYYWWKTYGINLRDHISGNAGAWYSAAQKAGLSTGKSPQVGAIVVMKYGASGWSGYGHVGIVTEVNTASGQIKIQDANYVGRFIVSEHWVDIDSSSDPIHGYIYP